MDNVTSSHLNTTEEANDVQAAAKNYLMYKMGKLKNNNSIFHLRNHTLNVHLNTALVVFRDWRQLILHEHQFYKNFKLG